MQKHSALEAEVNANAASLSKLDEEGAEICSLKPTAENEIKVTLI